MGSQSVLGRTFAISLLFHAGLLGGLVLFVSGPPVVSDTPLRVRILESPSPSVAPSPPPEAAAPPQAGPFDPSTGSGLRAGRVPVERTRRGGQSGSSEVPTERLAPRPFPVPDRPPSTSSGQAAVPPPPAPPPQVAARPAPETSSPTPQPAAPIEAPAPSREPVEGSSVPTPPERSGLFLGGPSRVAPSPPPVAPGPTAKGSSRPSLRDQIASLGSNLVGEAGEAKRTVNLDDREPDLLPYLAKLKRRIQTVWNYPEEARELGLTGELYLIFTLNKAGTLTSLRLVQSSGFPVLDEEAVRAVRTAAPYDPFPPEMGDEAMNIRASFHYLSPYRYRRN